MPTSTVNRPQPAQDEWREVKSAVLWQWTQQGQVFEGIFASIEVERLTDQKTAQPKNVEAYYFDMPTGDRCKIRETADLKQKIVPKHLGHRMRIRYESDLPNKNEDQSAMKVFKVETKPNVEPGYEHLQAA